MKKVLFVLSTILMLTVLLSFASCKKDDDVTDSAIDTSQSENQEPQEPISEYELIYESYGNGTCDVTGIWISPGSRDVTITVPAISPDGERVISCDIHCNPIPVIIEKDVFDNEICTPLLTAIENGALGGVADGEAEKNFYYRKFMSFFTLYDVNNSENNKEVIEQIRSKYPIIAEKAVYLFAPDASAIEVAELSSHIREYTYFYESESYYESVLISKDYKIYNSFCMDGVVKKIVFENGIQNINSAGGHKNVTEFVLPDSVVSVEENAFHGCDSLIQVENGVSYVDKWVTDCNAEVTNVSLRTNTVGIAERSFYGCGNLISIEIPTSVVSIGDHAFSYCHSLTNINIPNGITNIEDGVFSNCDSLISINIPSSVTSIGNYAFYYCKSLISIEIPYSIISIGNSAFSRCSSLISIKIPSNVTSIGDMAFKYCSSLTSIELPNNITSIGDEMFYGCSSLTSFEIPNSVTFIGDYSFIGCYSLTDIDIPDSVISIGFYAFAECCIINITIPNGVTTIGDSTFSNCDSLTNIDIPNSVTLIGDNAFIGCRSLTSIEIPNSVKSIGYDAFALCHNLETIIYHGTAEEWNAINDSNNEYDCTITFLG